MIISNRRSKIIVETYFLVDFETSVLVYAASYVSAHIISIIPKKSLRRKKRNNPNRDTYAYTYINI